MTTILPKKFIFLQTHSLSQDSQRKSSLVPHSLYGSTIINFFFGSWSFFILNAPQTVIELDMGLPIRTRPAHRMRHRHTWVLKFWFYCRVLYSGSFYGNPRRKHLKATKQSIVDPMKFLHRIMWPFPGLGVQAPGLDLLCECRAS